MQIKKRKCAQFYGNAYSKVEHVLFTSKPVQCACTDMIRIEHCVYKKSHVRNAKQHEHAAAIQLKHMTITWQQIQNTTSTQTVAFTLANRF